MKIVVDTNIIFSAILNTDSQLAEILLNSDKRFEFFNCNYMRFEIAEHWEKLKLISKLSDEKLSNSQYLIFSQLSFINEAAIPPGIWERAGKLVGDIDIDDIDFVVLTLYPKGTLWTGDKPLCKGLREKGFTKVFETAQIKAMTLKF